MSLREHITIARRFQRSIRVDSDIGKLDALQGFVCQRSAVDGLLGMASQVAATPQRAFTWTGPYGSGKSSLAVALAALLGPKGALRHAATEAIGMGTAQKVQSLLHPSPAGWLTIAVVGRRSDPVADISDALERARRGNAQAVGRPRRPAASGRELIERLLEEVQARPKDGVLLLIDELGKFLEGVASEQGGDVFFFQELAEAAARAKGRLIIVGILHQAFDQYAARLGRQTRDEWAKIQGRFSDIPLIGGVDETIDLVGRAIVSTRPHRESRAIADTIASTIRSRRPSSPKDLNTRLDACWPLHPVTALLLGPMSRRRFGQNERSVFGFLTSAEPGGFQDFLTGAPAESQALFGPDRFWDFLRINLEPAILASADSHRWAQGAEAVERAEARGSALHVQLAKAIAAIDLFRNGSGLAADCATLGTCVAATKADIDHALADLAQWSVAVFRKYTDAWAIYAGSDFDIEAAIAKVNAQSSGLDLARLSRLAGLQPVLAKRHYHQTGTMRWFQTELAALTDLSKLVHSRVEASGRFILAIPDSEAPRKTALAACSAASKTTDEHLVAIGLPRNAARILELGKDLTALEGVRVSRPELEGDNVARKEVAARIAAVAAELEQELRSAATDADWFVAGAQMVLPPHASLSQLASQLADERYAEAPIIRSELINRQRPSSNTQAGVRELMQRMVAAPDQLHLGIEGFPIERGLYSTVLATSGLHRLHDKAGYRFGAPSTSEIGQSFKPAWEAAYALFAGSDAPVSLAELYKLWEAPPYGIRRGVMPVLALAFILAHHAELAIYGEGVFQEGVNDYLADLLLQDEGLIALRRVQLKGGRRALLHAAAHAIFVASEQPVAEEPLEIARSLVRFVRSLPPWTLKTLSLSKPAIEIRRILQQASDPHNTLFVDLPRALGTTELEAYGSGLTAALHELGTAYPRMLLSLMQQMFAALGKAESETLDDARQRAATVSGMTGDLRLDAFTNRLTTYAGSQPEIEAIASLAINKPPRDWSDRDPDQAALALADFAAKFRRAELLARVKGRKPNREAIAVVIGTGEAGRALVEEFEITDRDRPQITKIADRLKTLLDSAQVDRNILLAALAEAGLHMATKQPAKLRKVG